MSWIADTLSGMKRIVQLDTDVARLRSSLEKAEATALDHEKRLIRIETMIELARNPPR
jgi:hypothetical protein